MNDTAAPQNLAVTQTSVTWTRGGSSPQLARVTFESSTDNVNFTLLGNGTPAGSNWTLAGLSLPTGQNFYIRARGYYRSGFRNGSESITESVRNAFIAGTHQRQCRHLQLRQRRRQRQQRLQRLRPTPPPPTPRGTPTPTPTATPIPTPTPSPTATPARPHRASPSHPYLHANAYSDPDNCFTL